MPYFIIRNFRNRGYFHSWDEERERPVFSKESAHFFRSHGAALFEMIRWKPSLKKHSGILQREARDLPPTHGA
jgi:hypothetical protein